MQPPQRGGRPTNLSVSEEGTHGRMTMKKCALVLTRAE
jgi:hypothetical protein